MIRENRASRLIAHLSRRAVRDTLRRCKSPISIIHVQRWARNRGLDRIINLALLYALQRANDSA